MNVDARLLGLIGAPLLAGLAACAAGEGWTLPELKLPEPLAHPCVACTPEELERLRAAWKSEGLPHKAVLWRVREADKALEQKLVFPRRGGQHNQWYQCEPCQHFLIHVEEGHQCPRCKKLYTGAPYDDVVFNRVHGDNLRGLFDSAWCYAVTGEAKYAEFARSVLLGYAERYLQYPYHDNACREGEQAAKSGGRLCEQTLGEAYSLAMQIAPAYDLVFNFLQEGERAKIREGLLLPMLENIDKNRMGKSNWQTWHNAGMLWGGAVLGDAAWVRKALAQQGQGFAWQMEHSVTAEGMWYENSWGYHFYTLSAMVQIAEGARRLGVDLWSHPHFRRMFTLPVAYTMPDGTLPRFGDDTTSRLGGDERMEAAFHAYRDPAILAVLLNEPRWFSVLLGRDTAVAAERSAPESAVFPGAGHAILRAGGAEGLAAVMTFGPFGGFHGHFDKLSFVFFGRGTELGVDPGRAKSQAYRLPIHSNWYRATIAHNAVVVDGKSQDGAAGELLAFAAAEGLAVAGARCDKAYKGVAQARWMALTPGYLLVFDALDADRECRFDWWYHHRGTGVECETAKEDGSLPKRHVGAEYVKNSKAGASAEPVQARFAAERTAMYLLADAQPGTEILIGDGVGASVEDRVPLAALTRKGEQAHFAVVLEVAGPGAPASVTGVAWEARDGGYAVTVSRGEAKDVFVFGPKDRLEAALDGKQLLPKP
ncbi:MAG: heparinase II/III family protein [Planctomycetota bacterium]|nr:heparinase II/III family protein [Planctomycetota bacterium]